MSNTSKLVVTIIVIVLVAGGIWWWSASQTGVPASPAATTAPAAAQPATGQNTQGVSTANLNQDLAQIDTQMSGFAADSASINQGLSDQPVGQQTL